MPASYQEIQAQIRDLTAAAEAARKAELEQALTQIRDLIQQYDLTIDDLQALFKKPRGKRAAVTAGQATKGTPKYRDPETGRTWTGQGKPPNWIKDAPDRGAFLIDAPSGSTMKKAGRSGVKRGAVSKRSTRKKTAA